MVGCVVTPTLSRGFPICQLSQSLTTFDLRDNNQTSVIPLLFKNRKAHFQTLLRGGVTDGSNMLIDFIVNKGLALWLGLGYLWGGVVEIRLRGQGRKNRRSGEPAQRAPRYPSPPTHVTVRSQSWLCLCTSRLVRINN